MLNFKYLKAGEAQSIINNVKEGKIRNNCICLNNTETILLRTNGAVIYGEYKQGNNRIKFTHSPQYPQPYIASKDYAKYKDSILKEWRKAYTTEAQGKLREVRALIANIMDNNNDAQQEPTITEKKEEVKEMNKELNVMGLAHKIRRELGLEGDYRAQMKMAMSYAWAIKKGSKTLEDILGTTEATAHTYNVANTTVEQEAAVTKDEPIKQEKPVSTTGLIIYLDKIEDGIAYFNKSNGSKSVLFLKYKVRNRVDMDKQFARDWLSKILNGLPNNSTIYFYGDYTEMTYLNNMDLRSLAQSKNIEFKQGLYGVAPSGIAV
nr:MAG TPA: hypothetical protein [Caudoviricetes sp.]